MIYLNGEWTRIEDAKVSVLDRGFIFGDGVYEVIPVYGRRAFRLQHHLRRLQYSLDGIRLANPKSDAQWTQLIEEIVARQDFADQAVYLQLTRGAAKRDHGFPKDVAPTVFMMSNPLATPPREQVERGVACVTAVDNRWLRCDLKTTALLGNVLLRQYAVEQGAVEAILFRDGYLTEASASNVMVVKDGQVIAPPKDNLILPGITYDVALELAKEGGLPLTIRPVRESEVWSADEIWISSSTREVIAVTTLDGKPVGNGLPGDVFRRMYALFQAAKSKG
jgi:D-alanine transaminase